jgi:methylated-DNA-[protein]-cysteine S-methyltransferase
LNRVEIQYFETPGGELILGAHAGELCLCDWRYRTRRATVDTRIRRELNADYVEKDTDLLRATRKQLGEYFGLTRKTFDLPLRLVGTAFQQRVWHALQKVPFGTTVTYLQLAGSLGDTNAVRAVAAANGANAISIIVPCHRVLGSNGDLVGYAGGLRAKADLLSLEFELSG